MLPNVKESSLYGCGEPGKVWAAINRNEPQIKSTVRRVFEPGVFLLVFRKWLESGFLSC